MEYKYATIYKRNLPTRYDSEEEECHMPMNKEQTRRQRRTFENDMDLFTTVKPFDKVQKRRQYPEFVNYMDLFTCVKPFEREQRRRQRPEFEDYEDLYNVDFEKVQRRRQQRPELQAYEDLYTEDFAKVQRRRQQRPELQAYEYFEKVQRRRQQRPELQAFEYFEKVQRRRQQRPELQAYEDLYNVDFEKVQRRRQQRPELQAYEDLYNVDFEKVQRRRQQRPYSNERKWFVIIDVEDYLPEEMKTKVNPIDNTLVIVGKRINQKEQRQKLKRVIPLPRNVNLEQLRVKYLPRGKLHVKAPFTSYEEVDTPFFYKGYYATTFPVSIQDQRKKYQQREELPRYFYHFRKNTTTAPNAFDTRCVRDETTGKWMVYLDVNAVGFRREEIQVRFDEKERVLFVEGRHQERLENARGIAVKTLRREFVLPEYLQGEQMRYRIKSNGILRIELPCLRKHCTMNKERFDYDQQEQMYEKFYQYFY